MSRRDVPSCYSHWIFGKSLRNFAKFCQVCQTLPNFSKLLSLHHRAHPTIENNDSLLRDSDERSVAGIGRTFHRSWAILHACAGTQQLASRRGFYRQASRARKQARLIPLLARLSRRGGVVALLLAKLCGKGSSQGITHRGQTLGEVLSLIGISVQTKQTPP